VPSGWSSRGDRERVAPRPRGGRDRLAPRRSSGSGADRGSSRPDSGVAPPDDRGELRRTFAGSPRRGTCPAGCDRATAARTRGSGSRSPRCGRRRGDTAGARRTLGRADRREHGNPENGYVLRRRSSVGTNDVSSVYARNPARKRTAPRGSGSGLRGVRAAAGARSCGAADPVDEHRGERQPLRVPQPDHEPERDRLGDERRAADRPQPRPPHEDAREDRDDLRARFQQRSGCGTSRRHRSSTHERGSREIREVEAHEQVVAQVVGQRPAQRPVPLAILWKNAPANISATASCTRRSDH